MALSGTEWGIRPVLFRAGSVAVPSYSFFMVLAVAVGLLLFWREARRHKAMSERTFYVLIGALFGGVLGAKLPMIILYWREMLADLPRLTLLISSRSIVGGLVGGAVGVYLVKKWMGITGRRGNLFVPGIAAAVAIGRLGCFLRGCCYGTPTQLPWGVDFGDGISRHPTQLYESVFMIMVLVAGWVGVRRFPEPAGLVFKMLMITYFAFRFLVEFIRDEKTVWLGLSLFQLVSVAMVVFYVVDVMVLMTRETEGKAAR